MNLGDVRTTYRAIRDRALEVAPHQAAYVNGLWADWDIKLSRLGDDHHPVTDQHERVLQHLSKAALEGDSVLDWLDAYADGTYDMLSR